MIVPGDDPVRFEIAQRSCEGLLRDAADAAQQLTVAVGSVGDRPLVSMIPFDQKKMIGRTSRATGTITVARWSPAPYDPTDGGPTLVQIEVEETFHGDIEGEGRAQLLQCLRADGSASFVGLERVTGTVADRHGTFVLQDAGTLDAAGRVEGSWTVAAGSATGELAGMRGQGGFSAALGEHATIDLEYWFE